MAASVNEHSRLLSSSSPELVLEAEHHGGAPALLVVLRWQKAARSLGDFHSVGLVARLPTVAACCVDQNWLYFLTVIVV